MSSRVQSSYRFARVPEWILYHPDLEPIDVRVFAVMDRFDGRECIPSRAAIGERIGASEATVKRAVARLRAVGAITVEERRVEGRQTSNRYQLAGDAPLAETPHRGSRMTRRRVNDDPHGGVTDDPADLEQKDPEVSPNGETRDSGTTANPSLLEHGLETSVALLDSVPTARRRSKRDDVFDALVAACGLVYAEMTARDRRACGVAAAELVKVGATPTEVHRRAGIYLVRMPRGSTLTPNALTRHWALCASANGHGSPEAREARRRAEHEAQERERLRAEAAWNEPVRPL